MLKGQWQYECECSFKLWHTIAKVELSEEIINELLMTGKTKKKVNGFISKAGNVFDTCLKYEDDTIKFDFNNPGEEEKSDNAKKMLKEKGPIDLISRCTDLSISEIRRLQ